MDDTEQAIAANKARGIWGPGWWLYESYQTAAGDTRHKASASHSSMLPPPLLVTTLTILWWQMCLRQSRLAHNLLTKTPPLVLQPSLLLQLWINLVITYQWQKKASGSTRYANVSGATSASIVLSGQTADNTGDKYRVKINTSKGAEEVVSDAATLTFVS